MKDLPIGISTFRDIIEGNFLYIDKTRYIYELIRPEKAVYFLSRPRRFGKSLLISTLYEIFKGNKELFKGLYIYDTDYDWESYPIVRISFAQEDFRNKDALIYLINKEIEKIGKKYGVSIEEQDEIRYATRFRELIESLYEKYNKPSVILIDEYDKPILDVIENIELAKCHRDTLRTFYTIIKEKNMYIRFVFLTGVSKFSKTGVFSGLNNLEDITMSMDYSALLGITQDELLAYFDEYIDRLGEATGITDRKELLNQIERWYNGYCFSRNCIRVYNPFSLLLLFKQRSFDNFWFETGTPTFLVKLIKDETFDVSMFEDLWVGQEAFSSYEIERLKVVPLLFQTGYLTIKDYNPKRRLYKLYYPNYEVEESFTTVLLEEYTNVESEFTDSYIYKLIDALQKDGAPDFPVFFDTLSVFFANIPYDIQIKREIYYQTIFYTVFLLLGLIIETEIKTNKGRIDVIIKDKEKNRLFIFEFKLKTRDKECTPDDAIKQIRENNYPQKYKRDYRDIYLIGVVFDMDEKNIGGWKVERG